MITVYKIQVSDTFGNSHSTNRDQTWSALFDKTFGNEEEAKEYIIGRTRIHVPELANFLINVFDEDKHEFCVKFCFTDDKYITSRRYFIGKPNIL
jgi:hypothetical protein